MMKRICAAMLVAAFAYSFSSVGFAQEAVKKEAKTAEKHVLKSASCDPSCGFMVRSHDEKELTEIMMNHAKKSHNMNLTEKDVKGMMKTEGMAETKEMKKEEKK